MNSFTGSGSQRGPSPASSAAVSFDSYQFDFGIGSGSSSSARPLKDQKVNHNAASSNPPFSSSNPASASLASSTGTQPAFKPSWNHQPAASARSGLQNPRPPMVGDIFGRSWGSGAPMAASTTRIGIVDSNPNLFSDLVGSALGQGRSTQNVPLKSASAKISAFSMTGLHDSLPKTNTASNNNPSLSSIGNFTSLNHSGDEVYGAATGASMKLAAGSISNTKQDPFGSLTDFGLKHSSNVPLSSGKLSNSGSGNLAVPSGSFNYSTTDQTHPQEKSSHAYDFGVFQNAKASDYRKPASPPQSQPAQSDVGGDPFNIFFSSSLSSTAPTKASSASQPIPELNDWDMGADGGHDGGGMTTELEGIPPPPAGVNASIAKTKGMENYKQGQFADAIKWLSWAVLLLEKHGDDASTEVLICRASCYKEVGEYKKAIADCSKVLEHDSNNVAVLLQRALLYESSEKYRLGAEDLRMVLKIDPGNRLARSTIHRLNQFAD
ncbi:Outer envelope protein 64, chloroplastic [Apostasia shenzhenica]|uniref:Outer envelope protein 64, chloroplastic n=1 Tax=Apostasia shenzhenica TaxID=1088818 RepID=A0A2I0AS90_9ASPA|nr:Outer envelope protein 64, chloroplastic [Apostasia shenzhenica]